MPPPALLDDDDTSAAINGLTLSDNKVPLSPPSAEKTKNYGEMYVMESTCPHLGAELSHADIEEGPESAVAVCPWHKYDFDLKTGQSDHGIRACVYAIQLRSASGTEEAVWVEKPDAGGWEVVELRPVSEEFADPPPPAPSLCVASQDSSKSSSSEPDIPDPPPSTLLEWSVLILNTPNPEQKVQRTRLAIDAFRNGKLKSIGRSKGGHGSSEASSIPTPPEIPPREPDLKVVAPGKVGRRGKAGTVRSRVVILHALANIEQWAIDLAWDIIARFANVRINGKPLPQQFFSDWTKVAQDEAKHFSLLRQRLLDLGSFYGEHTVHAGLWESAQETSHSLSARLAIIHLVHEARGLDVNPATIEKFRKAGDADSVKVLEVIHHDEITHVTAGHRWLSWVCDQTGEDPVVVFRDHVRRHFSGVIKGPYNVDDRKKAGMTPDFYEDLMGEMDLGKSVHPPSTVTAVGYEVAP